jgi:hypothetical protein
VARPQRGTEVCTEVCTRRSKVTLLTRLARATKRLSLDCAG